ncbi:MAG: hypothetical protein ACRCVA_06310, partial [Phreatobacter sp.]
MLHRRSFLALFAGGLAVVATQKADAQTALSNLAESSTNVSVLPTPVADSSGRAAGEPREMQYWYYRRRRYWRRRYYWRRRVY